MKSVGVRELKEHASQILREVQEGETIEVTVRGKRVARIERIEPSLEPKMPAARWEALTQAEREEYLREFFRRSDDLARKIGEKWPKGVSAVEAVREGRDRLDHIGE